LLLSSLLSTALHEALKRNFSLGWDGRCCPPLWCYKILTPFVAMMYIGYYHELFLRQKVNLCHQIPRLRLKGTGVRKPASPETEPNFYTMPWLPELDATMTTQGIERYTKNSGSPMNCMDPSGAPVHSSSFGGPKEVPRLDDCPKWVTPQLMPLLPPGTMRPFEVHPCDAQTTVTNWEATQVVNYPNDEGRVPATWTAAASAFVPIVDSDPFDCWYQPFHPVVAEQGVPGQECPALVHAVVEAQGDPQATVVSHYPGWSYHHYPPPPHSAIMPTLDEMDSLPPVISLEEILSTKKDDDDIGLAADCNNEVQPTLNDDDVLQSLLQCYGIAFASSGPTLSPHESAQGSSPVHYDDEVPTFWRNAVCDSMRVTTPSQNGINVQF
jgi:hypothetical protein